MDAVKTASLAFAVALLAACGSEEKGAGNQAADGGGKTASPGAPTEFTGLYEGGTPGRPDQLCIVDEASPKFGLIVWGSNDHSCMGSGDADRKSVV